MAESSFRETLGFLDQLGVFDVVLPFLLVFTIMFAILEKTKVFGMEKVGDKEYTKKNLNSLAAFVIAFFVIGSSRLVELVTEISANLIILMLASISFLILAGSFHQEKPEGYFLTGNFRNIFMGIMFIGLVFIFLNALQNDRGETYLEIFFDWADGFANDVTVTSIVLLIIVVAFIAFITRSPKEGGGSKDDGGGH